MDNQRAYLLGLEVQNAYNQDPGDFGKLERFAEALSIKRGHRAYIFLLVREIRGLIGSKKRVHYLTGVDMKEIRERASSSRDL